MQAQKINDAYYIDGGYRNNLPIDVALQQGATECITVDVQGPGINKRTVLTEETAQLSLGSPWSLGSFLVFDAQRSLDNMTLGYLETLKVFGKYQGHWYTFEKTVDFQPLWRGFLKELRQTDPLLYQELKKKEFWKKMRKFYQQDVPFEQWGRILIECTAKVLYLAPTVIYEQETMLTALAEKIALKAVEEADAWSITEWLSYYRDRFFVLSEQNRFFFFYRTQQLNLPALQQIRRRYPLTVLMAAYSHYLLKGAENG
jgi:NTE family protein